MRLFSYLFVMFFLIAGCKNTETEEAPVKSARTEQAMAFDKEKWAEKEGQDYSYRKEMVDAVLHNDALRKLTKGELLQLLGSPDYTKDAHYYYRIEEKRLFHWTLHTRTLVVRFDEDDSVEWIKLHE